MKVTIPKSLSDVNSSWLSDLVKIIDKDFTENCVGLSHLQILPFDGVWMDVWSLNGGLNNGVWMNEWIYVTERLEADPYFKLLSHVRHFYE